jgi:glycosyltransferase involved in cell wall biosynthesis
MLRKEIRMVKVINIISDTNIGGAGKCVINFCNNYDTQKFDVAIILPKGSALIEEIKKTPARIIEIDGLKDKSLDFNSLFKLIKILRKEKPDIVHTHASSIARLAAKFVKGCKIIFTRHSVFPISDKIKHGVGRFIYKTANELLADKIIAVAEAAKDNLTDGGIDADKIEVILNGVEKVEKISEDRRQEIKKQYGINDNEYVIGIMARLDKVKGHEFFIDSAKIILDKKINAKFFILGTGAEEAVLKAKVKKLKLEDKIIFPGFIKNVRDFLNIFDVQVNCSYGTEATSLALLEGMSLGVPAVVTNYGGNPGVIIEGENGLLVPIKSPKDTANAIIKILENSKLREHMKQRSIEIFDEKFTVQVYTKNIENLYLKLEEEPKMKKINLLDIIIVVAVLIASLIGFIYLNKDDTVMNNTQKVIYQVQALEVDPEVFDVINIDTDIYDSTKNILIGKVTKKESMTATREEKDSVNGVFKDSSIPNKVDIILTIEANAEYTKKDIMVGEYKIKVGQQAYVKGKGYAFIGFVVNVER